MHNFCSEDLGAFYLDVIKDRQYTTQADSLARRSAQTALYHIVEAFSRWIAPILTFTAEEIWAAIPGEHEESILFDTWYAFPLFPVEDTLDNDYWQQILAVRVASSKELEKLRSDKTIGSSLDAELDLYCSEGLKAQLEKLGDELRFVLICSYVHLHDLADKPSDAVDTELEGLSLVARASEHPKCVRCWHHREDVGQNSEHPELCGRCVENVAGSGESREFA